MKKLLVAMLYFSLALILLLAVFYGLWVYGSKDEASSDPATNQEQQKAEAEMGSGTSGDGRADDDGAAHESQAISQAEPSPEPPLAQTAPDEEQDQTLPQTSPQTPLEMPAQGPEAGGLVPPPSRNVTPGHQTSPLAQQTPLQREEGNAQPLPPKRPDLPKFFRKVVAKEATHLVATVSKKPVDLRLAHVTGPSSDQNCHMFGQQAPCAVLARTALQRFLRGRGISCDISKKDLEVYQDRTQEQKPLTGLCVLGRLNKASGQSQTKRKQQDLAEWLVRYGWAVPDEGYYHEALKEAKRAKRGLYADGTATSRDSTPSSLPAAASTTLDRLAQEAIRPSLEGKCRSSLDCDH